MFPLIPLLMDTVETIDRSDALNIVHEWGVVVFEQSGSVYCGGPDFTDWPDPGDVCAEAPVVWIHGVPFQGVFTVTVPAGGLLTYTHPQPTVSSTESAIWELTSGEPGIREEIPLPYSGPYEWALESWREVPSLPLTIRSSGAQENFLYYECTVNAQITEKLFQWASSGNPVFNAEIVREALYFTPYSVFPVEITGEEFIPFDLPMAGEANPALAEETFCMWAHSMLKSSEIEALTETWGPVFNDGDSYWLVFPIPAVFHNQISSINLETDAPGGLEYHRLFIGAVKLQEAGQ